MADHKNRILCMYTERMKNGVCATEQRPHKKGGWRWLCAEYDDLNAEVLLEAWRTHRESRKRAWDDGSIAWSFCDGYFVISVSNASKRA